MSKSGHFEKNGSQLTDHGIKNGSQLKKSRVTLNKNRAEKLAEKGFLDRNKKLGVTNKKATLKKKHCYI